MVIKDEGICIRTVDYSETSQVVTFFTRQTGKVTLMAKGSKRARSPFGGTIEMFAWGQIAFSDSGRDKMGMLAEFEQMAQTPGSMAIAGDIGTLNCCLFAIELINLLTTDFDPHPGLFDALQAFLQEVSKKDALAQLVIFQLRLLREIGLSPVFEYCVNCKNQFDTPGQQLYFSNNAKGLICRDCQGAFPDSIQIAKNAVKYFTNIDSISGAEQRTVEGIESILTGYFSDILGRAPKMAKYVTGQQGKP
jgi:DNA repair protein RecO (recombination protein O)